MAWGRGGVAEGGGAAGGAGVGVVIRLAVTLVPPPVQLAATYTPLHTKVDHNDVLANKIRV